MICQKFQVIDKESETFSLVPYSLLPNSVDIFYTTKIGLL